MKNILLLGATGSIGESVLSVISQNKESLNLFGISLNKNILKSQKILKEYSPDYIFIDDHDSFKSLASEDSERYLNDEGDLEKLINKEEIDIIVCATSGFAGLKAAYIAAKTGKKILLANKESIVAGGDLILPLAKKNNSEIIPIDSEHNAIFQCLSGEKGTEDVKRITITASGGPFINTPIKELKHVTVEDALNHPNWKMGSKVTIDSATLVNKCLELIEAKYLFDMNEKYFELVVHPQSIIHSIVTFIDGSSLCQMSAPDMRVPIAHALSEEQRLPIDFNNLDFSNLNLSFQEFPSDRSEIQDIAREVCNEGGFLGTIFNAANEVAVESFLNKKINFNQIYEVIYRTFDKNHMSNDLSIESINEADVQTRIKAEKVVKSLT
jgi:1-deoxy-D-xylulose-5-phosphate reductoisomerase